jgi:cobalt-zinc-cadmium efflux system protein
VSGSAKLERPIHPKACARGAVPDSLRMNGSGKLLVLVYMGVEVVGGLLADSLALIADAGHMFSDAGALGLTLFAMRFVRRPATPQRTYGLYRAEILAALVNGATLVAVASYIFIEAFERIRTPPEVQGA